MAETKVINLEVKDNSEEAAKAFEKLSKAIDKTEKSANDLDATFEEVYGDLKPLTARMGEAEDRLYEMSLAGQQATQEYKDLLAAVGNYKKVQMQTDLVIDAAALTIEQKLGSALQGVTSGFVGVRGAMGLLGPESQELEKALLKVQSAMALAEGVRGVREAMPAMKSFAMLIKGPLVKAFTTLKGAIITTGIGALVVAIAMAADAMGLFESSTEDATKANEDFAKSIAKTSDEIERRISRTLEKQKQAIKEAKILGASEAEIFAMRKKLIDDEENLKIKQYNANLLRIAKLSKSKKQEVIDEVENLKKSNDALSKSLFDKINDENDYDLQRRDLELEYQEWQKGNRSALDNEEKARNDAAKAERKRLSDEKKANDKLAYDESIRLAKEKAAKDIEIADEQYDLLQSLRNNAQEQEIYELAKDYDAKFELAMGNAELEKALEEKQKSDILEINNRYRAEEKAAQDIIDKAEEEANKKKLADEKKLQEQKQEAVKSTLSSISNLAELFAGKSEAQQKRAFKIQKAVNIAQATIDTYKAANLALASAPPPLSFAFAGAAITAGLLNVKNIASQQFSGGASSGGGSGGGSTPNLSTPQSVQPNFNIVGDSGVNQLDALKSQPSKVYVVSGEVSSAQALDRNRQRNATL